jgi:tetratricopeptide (TPR) repeat protein
MSTRWVPRAARAVPTVLIIAWLAAAGWASDADDLARALELYDAGQYAAAGKILERIDAAGDLDGPMLYRLSFCRGQTGDPQGQRATLERAVETLRAEVVGAPTLEPSFYLSNALRNLGRRPEAREAAVVAVERIGQGDWSPGDDPVEAFRAAKLYADLGRQDDAATWYRKALEGFEADPEAYPVYIRWSRGYLADLAAGTSDYEAAEAELTALSEIGEPGQAEWDRLAVVRVRLGKYGEAVEAWRQAERANPAEGDRARYSWRLAAMAEKLDFVPDATPDGRAIAELAQGEIEALLKEQAARVMEITSRAAAEPLDDAEREGLADEIETIRPLFVAAALEYTARGLPIRETAFFGGFAPLIFHESRWKLPEYVPEPEAE